MDPRLGLLRVATDGVVDAGGLETGLAEPGFGGDHLVGGLGLDTEMVDAPRVPAVLEQHELEGRVGIAKLA